MSLPQVSYFVHFISISNIDACLVPDGEDYIGGPGLLFFNPITGSAVPHRECFEISILDDIEFENDEIFEVELALNNATSGVIVDLPFITGVNILDDDGKGSIMME